MNDLITSVRLMGLSLLVCSIIYPAVVLGLAAAVAPEKRAGSLIRNGQGAIVGSRLIAQGFTRPAYFWPRPSAVDYNAAAAGGSNLSPANPRITDRAREIVGRLQLPEGKLVPADLVLASGGGLDPHITLAAALFQAPRVASARNRSQQEIEDLIRRHVDSPTLVPLGRGPIVNVLELNLALDAR